VRLLLLGTTIRTMMTMIHQRRLLPLDLFDCSSMKTFSLLIILDVQLCAPVIHHQNLSFSIVVLLFFVLTL
jgi:hypothetical protein